MFVNTQPRLNNQKYPTQCNLGRGWTQLSLGTHPTQPGISKTIFEDQDQDWKCLNLNDKTETEKMCLNDETEGKTENVWVSMMRPKLKKSEYQWRDWRYPYWDSLRLRYFMEIENVTHQDLEISWMLRPRLHQDPCWSLQPIHPIVRWTSKLRQTKDKERSRRDQHKVKERKKKDIWWKMSFDGRQPLKEDNHWWRTTFDKIQPLIEDDLSWETPFNGRWLLMDDVLWWNL